MFHRTALWLGFSLFLAAPTWAQDDPIESLRTQDSSDALGELDETVTIMARVLKKSIEATFERSDEADAIQQRKKFGKYNQLANTQEPAATFFGAMVAEQNDRAVTGCRGYLLPGAGVVFVISVNLPIEEVSPDSEDRSLWDEAKREIEGKTEQTDNPFLAVAQGNRTHHFVPGEVDNVRSAILAALAKHGRRLEGLGSKEKVWVSLRLGNRSGTAWLIEKRNLVLSVLKSTLDDLPENAEAKDLAKRIESARY